MLSLPPGAQPTYERKIFGVTKSLCPKFPHVTQHTHTHTTKACERFPLHSSVRRDFPSYTPPIEKNRMPPKKIDTQKVAHLIIVCHHHPPPTSPRQMCHASVHTHVHRWRTGRGEGEEGGVGVGEAGYCCRRPHRPHPISDVFDLRTVFSLKKTEGMAAYHPGCHLPSTA